MIEKRNLRTTNENFQDLSCVSASTVVYFLYKGIAMPTKTSLPSSSLTAISPLDGRYQDRTKELQTCVSEYALIRTRFEIEATYLIILSEIGIIRKLTRQEKNRLENFSKEITVEVAEQVKDVEKETRHDVKAMEKVFRSLVKGTSLSDTVEMIHFGLTSEDINNISQRLMLQRASTLCLSHVSAILDELVKRGEKDKATPMLARTHGQAAVPTTLGKELIVFAQRLHRQISTLPSIPLTGKLNGAVGNYNALVFVYPKINWMRVSEMLLIKLSLISNLVTIQINQYDDMIEYFQAYKRINTILIDFSQDIWRYISDHWFVQVAKKGEVGSSTMPQKVNPIDFENAEGNLTIANTLFDGFSQKLGISRLQRDLSDSTTIRNMGSALAYSLLGYKSIETGLTRIMPNYKKLDEALHEDFSILTEGVQTFLRTTSVEDPYSLIKSLSRGKHITKQEWTTWIKSLPITSKEKSLLQHLSPTSYVGLAKEITEKAIKEIRSNKQLK